MRLATILSLMAVTASAAPRAQVRLVVSRNAESLSCPSETQLADAVAAQLGYMPFSNDAKTVMLVEFKSTRRAVVTRNENGVSTGTRELSAGSATCEALASSVTLALSVAVDPQAFSSPVAPQPAPAVAPAPLAPPAPRVETMPIEFELGAGIFGALGAAPTLAAGGLIHAGFAWPRFSIALEGRADIPTTVSVRGGSVTSSFLLAGLAPCGRVSIVSLCALLNVGGVRASSTGFAGSTSQTALLVLLGGRVLATIPLISGLTLAPYLELQGALTRVSLVIDRDVVWSNPAIAGALGLQVQWVFR